MRAGSALILLSLAGCSSVASSAPESAGHGSAECAVRLPPRAGSASSAGSPSSPVARDVALPARVAPPSSIVVHAEMPLAPLKQLLESRIQQRLATGRVRIGPGGTVSYSVDRGALSLSVSRTALLIETPVQARAEACRGNDCYASCEPQALVRAEVPLMLRPDYRFQRASVSLKFTRGCKVRTLGGLLTLDVTPTLEAQLAPQLDEIAREIDQHLPDVASEVESAWERLSAPRTLPFGGCFVLAPFGVVQGPLLASAQVLQARFALLATPELHAPCAETPPPKALPPLATDLSLPAEGVMRLGLVTPLASIERAFESAQPTQVSGKRLRVTRALVTATATATATSQAGDVAVELILGGEVCGNVALNAGLDFSADGQFIGLARAALSAHEQERAKKSELEPRALTQALAAAPRVSPLLSVTGFREMAPTLAATLSQPSLDVSAKVSSARPAGATARGDRLVAWLEARGGLWLKQK